MIVIKEVIASNLQLSPIGGAKAERLSEMIAFFGFSPVVQGIEWEFPKLLIWFRFSAGLLYDPQK